MRVQKTLDASRGGHDVVRLCVERIMFRLACSRCFYTGGIETDVRLSRVNLSYRPL